MVGKTTMTWPRTFMFIFECDENILLTWTWLMVSEFEGNLDKQADSEQHFNSPYTRRLACSGQSLNLVTFPPKALPPHYLWGGLVSLPQRHDQIGKNGSWPWNNNGRTHQCVSPRKWKKSKCYLKQKNKKQLHWFELIENAFYILQRFHCLVCLLSQSNFFIWGERL